MKFWGIRAASLVLGLGLVFLIQNIAQAGGDLEKRMIVLAGLYVTLAVSLNLINGITGQFSIGHAAFYMVGAYTAGILSQAFYKDSGMTGLPWLLLMIVASALAAALAGLVVGLPSLRLRGDYLAIVTLGFGEIIRIVVQNIESIGGSYGLKVDPRFDLVWPIWLLAVVCIAVCRNLLKTAHGLPFLAVREDEIAAQAMGVNVTRVKVTAFVMGSMFAGAAGALFAHFETFISPNHFTMDQSFIVLTMVVLGGTGSITGSTIAAIALYYLPEKMRELPPVAGNSLLAGVLAVVVAVSAIRWVDRSIHSSRAKRSAWFVGAVAAAFFAKLVLTMVLAYVPALRGSTFDAAKLRMVIFAATLVVLMMIRPQGIFSHYEFSWDAIARLLRLKKPRESTT